MSSLNNGNGWRVATAVICALITVVTTLSLFITTGLRGDIAKIEDNLYDHFTNAEIHIPRAQVVSQAEFYMYCYTADKRTDEILEEIKKKR